MTLLLMREVVELVQARELRTHLPVGSMYGQQPCVGSMGGGRQQSRRVLAKDLAKNDRQAK